MSDVKTIDLLTFGGEDVKCVRLEDYERLTKQRDELQRENRIIREQHAEVVKQLTDPIVRAKMLEPSPPIYLHTDYDQVKKQRDKLVKALELIAGLKFLASVERMQKIASEALASVKESK